MTYSISKPKPTGLRYAKVPQIEIFLKVKKSALSSSELALQPIPRSKVIITP